jgi:hypothetical protein
VNFLRIAQSSERTSTERIRMGASVMFEPWRRRHFHSVSACRRPG